MARTESDKLARSLKILHLLGSRSWVPAEELASQLNVTLRTVYRDVAGLQSRGIPIQALRGPGGGYTLSSEHQLSQIGSLVTLDTQQALSLLSSRISHRQDRGGDPDSTRRYFERILETSDQGSSSSGKRRVLFDSTDWYWRDDGVPLLADFWEAIFADWEVEVRHRDRNSDVVHEDRLQPYGLVWKAGQWYVVGLNIRVGRIQRIRVERVLQVTPTKTNFSYPEGFDLEGWWRDDLTRFGTGANRVVLEIGKGAIADFLRLGRKQTTKVDVTDDHLRMELFVDKWEWLIPLLMSYGAEVVVIEPTELRDAIMERHRLAVTALEQGQAISDIRSKPEDNRLRPTRGGRY